LLLFAYICLPSSFLQLPLGDPPLRRTARY
jgi:hypothetical protein